MDDLKYFIPDVLFCPLQMHQTLIALNSCGQLCTEYYTGAKQICFQLMLNNTKNLPFIYNIVHYVSIHASISYEASNTIISGGYKARTFSSQSWVDNFKMHDM